MDGEKVSYEFQRKWRSGGRKWSEFQDKGNCDVPLIISNPIKLINCTFVSYQYTLPKSYHIGIHIINAFNSILELNLFSQTEYHFDYII